MRPRDRFLLLLWATSLLCLQPASAAETRASKPRPELQAIEELREAPAPAAVFADTTWLADWEFGSASCDAAGWTLKDNRILRDASNFWHTGSDFAGTGGISGQAAILSGSDPCWEDFGYGNDWDYAIVCEYTGAGATLSFDYLLDSSEGSDFMIVEADSLCASDSRVDYTTNPADAPDRYRLDLFTDSGLVTAGNMASLALPDFGAPEDTHCVYIRFRSYNLWLEGGDIYSTIGAALVVDDISITGGLAYVETFETALNPHVSFVNSAPAAPFGLWARLHPYATDNDICNDARDCAWIFSDPTLPAYTTEMAFGPDGVVVRNWLDNVILSPWVSLPAGQGGTILRYRLFPGNNFTTGAIAANWSVRTKREPGGSIECVSPWKSTTRWNSLSQFIWRERWDTFSDLTPYVDPDAVAIQVRFRVADYQYLYQYQLPGPLDPGPGPYLDRVRLGRVVMNGPEIRGSNGFSETAQDNFPSELTDVDPVEDFTPSTDRLGVSDFSPTFRHLGSSLYIWYSKTRDSLWVRVRDLRGAGGLTSISFHGAIVAGPHVGKAPPPWTVGPNGFFDVPADSVRVRGEVVLDHYFADLDDRYFRGGDELYYFWSATDAAGGHSSLPDALTAPPVSVAQAEAATGGLFAVSFLPTIDWDPSYLARIQADPHGKLDPTPAERAASRQRSCILYQGLRDALGTRGYVRRSGPANRTAFMYTLDRLGYAGAYDVYDQLLLGVANNQVASRASVEVAGGYSLIVLDAHYGDPELSIPMGWEEVAEGRVPQSQWYQAWLAAAAASPAGRATLWMIGGNIAGWTSIPDHITTVEAAVIKVDAAGVDFGTHPPIVGQNAFSWADGSSSDFTADRFALSTFLCGRSPYFTTIEATGTGVVTHRHIYGSMPGAVVMNANPAAAWNTILMSQKWDELLDADGSPASQVTAFVDKIVRAALADSCERNPDPATDVPDTPPGIDALPRQTALYPNVPNPFNPVTTLHFDIARDGRVELRIHDAAGRRVRQLVNGPLPRRHHEIVWDGRDDAGIRLPSGVYFARLYTTDGDWARKLVLLR